MPIRARSNSRSSHVDLVGGNYVYLSLTHAVWHATRQALHDARAHFQIIDGPRTDRAQLRLYLMPLDLNLFLEFHPSECCISYNIIDLLRVYFSRPVYGGRGFFKKLVLIFSTSLVPLPDGSTQLEQQQHVCLHALQGQGCHHLMPLSCAGMLLIIRFSRAI
jgi:hypothetical protein